MGDPFASYDFQNRPTLTGRGSRGEGHAARRFPQRGNRLWRRLALPRFAPGNRARSAPYVRLTLSPRAPQYRTRPARDLERALANPAADRLGRFAASPRRGSHSAHRRSRPIAGPTHDRVDSWLCSRRNMKGNSRGSRARADRATAAGAPGFAGGPFPPYSPADRAHGRVASRRLVP